LSDTTDPAIWIDEEARFAALRERTGAHAIYYRHRLKNVARKAGNIADWVTRFGGSYDYMIVLDADSLMTGETIVRLVAAMECHPQVGLMQTLPILVGGNTLFARLQQFAGRVYGPLIAHGIALWHGAEGNYWGHNAIIRVAAFAAHAGLPQLRGPKPFGGHILSHDFVEAALLRRAGWGVYLVPSLSGSYEESPPTLTDHAQRDRRWCQGNLQHVGVLPARGLHWVSRLHLLTGIGSYITAPLWMLFLLAGMLISLQAQFIRPEYFPSGASTLFPRWPAQDPIRAAWVFGLTMTLLIAPKVLGYLTMLFRRGTRRGIGGVLRGFASLMMEIVVSALIAPVMMLLQARAVLEVLTGRDSGWNPQRRGDGTVARSVIVKHYMGHTIVGVLLALGAASVSFWLFLWMFPVIAGLCLAIPVALVTSHTQPGAQLRATGLLLTPEELTPPPVLRRAHELSREETTDREACLAEPLMRLIRDEALLRFHLGQLSEAKQRRHAGQINVDLVVARAKIADIQQFDVGFDILTNKERFAVLSDRSTLEQLTVGMTSARFASD
jgi:membrane glycosyltransferase